LKFISDTKWLSLITETYLEDLDAHKDPFNGGGQDEEGHKEGEKRLNEGEEGHDDGAGLYYEGVGVTGLLQDPHPHVNLGLATSFTLL
jgi:hypothetical protein